MKEREERQQQRERMLSELTAPTVAVANKSQLREESGKNFWSTALVLMLEASATPRLDREDRERLMKVTHKFFYILILFPLTYRDPQKFQSFLLKFYD